MPLRTDNGRGSEGSLGRGSGSPLPRAELGDAQHRGYPDRVATVARICRDLDGIPLAIELAAARTRTLSVDEIAAHLDDRFGFLKYWRRVAVPRHQTLKATMDWSYELLSQAEREVLRRLSVFAGGFTLRAAAAVCVGADEAKALDLVGRLVERSLVVADLREGETRYRLLETVRQYASRTASEAGEADETRRAHAVTFVRVAIEGSLGGEDGLSRVAVEHDNVLTALEWSLSAGDESGPELACAYGRFWLWRGQFQEARPWLERALSAHRQRDELRAELLGLLGAVLHEIGDLARADEALSEGLQLARGCGIALSKPGCSSARPPSKSFSASSVSARRWASARRPRRFSSQQATSPRWPTRGSRSGCSTTGSVRPRATRRHSSGAQPTPAEAATAQRSCSRRSPWREVSRT